MQLVFLTTHLPSYLAICGLDPMLSAQTLGMIGGFNVLGSLFFGWAGQRWNKLALLGGIYIFRSIALAWYFTLPPTPATTLLFGAIMGFLWMGVGPLVAGAVAEMFGLKWQAMIQGLAFMSHQVGSFLGALAAGAVRRARLLHHGVADRRRARAGGRHHPGRVRADPAERAAEDADGVAAGLRAGHTRGSGSFYLHLSDAAGVDPTFAKGRLPGGNFRLGKFCPRVVHASICWLRWVSPAPTTRRNTRAWGNRCSELRPPRKP